MPTLLRSAAGDGREAARHARATNLAMTGARARARRRARNHPDGDEREGAPRGGAHACFTSAARRSGAPHSRTRTFGRAVRAAPVPAFMSSSDESVAVESS